jgi:hypothetical protein
MAAPTSSVGPIKAYIPPPPAEEGKGAPRVAVVQPAQETQGGIDPSLVISDQLRRAEVRPGLFALVIRDKYHGIAVQQLKQKLLPSKADYTYYLLGLRHDVALIESALKKTKIPLTLDDVYRSEAIESDLQALKATDEPLPKQLEACGHAKYFATIADQPHRLIAHLAVHHLGFMFGGQTTSKTLRGQEWGTNAASLYRFSNLSALLPAFSVELTRYLHRLPEAQYQEYMKEVTTAWIFACHLEQLYPEKPM